MKSRLLALTSPNFSPFDVLLTEFPSYTQTKGGSAGFTNCNDAISTSFQNKPSFTKTDTVLPFSSDLQYNEKGAGSTDIHYVVKLNV